MKVADLDFYFNLRREIEKNALRLSKYDIARAYTIDLHKLLTSDWLYKTDGFYMDDTTMDVISLQYKVERENKFKLHIYDTDTGKSKFMTLKELPSYLKKNKVANLQGNEETISIQGFRINVPRTFYNLKDILVYVNQKQSIFVWTKDACFKIWDIYSYSDSKYFYPSGMYSDSKYFYPRGMYSGDINTYGIKVRGGGIKFYYREPSKYIYLSDCIYSKEIASMTREQFIEYSKFGKFDFFGD